MKKLVSVEGHRWAIEDSFEAAKNELGLDHNETRSWHGWHRHVSLVMLAFAMMAVIRHNANAAPPKKMLRTSEDTPDSLIRWSVQEIRRIAISSPSGESNPLTSSHGHCGEAPIKPKHDAHILKQKRNCNARLGFTGSWWSLQAK